MLKRPVHYREIVIGFAIGIALLILGSFIDLNVSSNILANRTGEPIFAAILSGIVCIPSYLALIFGGSMFFFNCPKENRAKKYFCMVIGFIAVGLGVFFAIFTTRNISEVLGRNLNLYIMIPASVVVAGITILFILINHKLSKKIDHKRYFSLAFLILILIAIEGGLHTVLKYFPCRPRPYVVLNKLNNIDFRNWWQWAPFSHISGEEFKSFPSGHAGASSMMSIVIPILLSMWNKTKDNRKIQVLGFYIGLLWGIIAALARVLALRHFISDVGAGIICAMLTILVIELIYSKYHKVKNENYL